MGGYALYVWGSYGVMALLVVIEVYLVLYNRKSLRGQLRRTLASLRRVEE
jgi:heme exporter protein D